MRKVEMVLARDEFVVSFDPAKATSALLIATIKEAGYTAQILGKDAGRIAAEKSATTWPSGIPLLDEALAQAERENKLLVLDFHAAWCAPCKRMEQTTFADVQVAALLQQCVVVKIDSDQQAETARRFGVVGLPDIRFITPGGREVRRLRGFHDAEAFAGELERFIRRVEKR